MASIWKHPASQYWTACFRDSDGKQRRVSTKTTDRKLAKRLANEFESALRSRRTLHQLEKVLRQFHEELNGESIQRRSLRAFCAEWLEEREPSISESTRKFYRCSVTKMLSYFGELAERPISEITRKDLISLRNELSKGVSATTVNHDLVTVRQIFSAAKTARLLIEDPSEDLKPVRASDNLNETKRRSFTIAELQRLLAVADSEWASLIKVGLYSGGRFGDIALLRWANVDFERSELRFTARKTGKAACIPIVGPLRDHLLSLPSSDDPRAFLHPRSAEIWERRRNCASLSQQFGELLEQAGLRVERTREPGSRRCRPHELSFHSLRHTAVSFLKDAGIPQATVMELVGHSSAEISALYTHVGRESLERAAASLPAL
jgi:integrase